ncbi:hypothetical protein F8O06_02665 [Pseudoclavibacter sp. CFCC 14310]|uniref:hypothetical protein n=1 Tax=Pseudoclavibacter sp. CFCC 14310 TaxID=2615180 RepID=UPI0013017766|nr:hypothetical protein [Pseudoclavibacter sp. CFCC 14310]KAB1647459.1 hypothetical protein F8O06_02665 [Pseudoclavibacter sp. CFCC 14310]
MALPSNVGFGTVTGRFIRATADSTSDSDSDPDGVPLDGLKIVFRSSISRAKDSTATPPVTIIFDTVQAVTDADGVLTDPDGNASIRLIATDDPDLQPSGWTWTATITGPTIGTISTTFTLSEGQTIDLTTVIEVPASPGKDLPAWQAAVDAVEAARGGMVVGGTVSGDNLVLTTLDGTQMTAGNVRGPKGDTGGTVVQAGTGLTTSGAGTAASPLTLGTLNGASLRRDTTVGERVIATIGGVDTMLYGDTGWRDITGLLVNGWVATTLRVRRLGSVVAWFIVGLSSANATNDIAITPLGGGWRPPGNTMFPVARSTGVTYIGLNGNSALFGWARFNSGASYEMQLQSVTSDAWPTSLPGTPA